LTFLKTSWSSRRHIFITVHDRARRQPTPEPLSPIALALTFIAFITNLSVFLMRLYYPWPYNLDLLAAAGLIISITLGVVVARADNARLASGLFYLSFATLTTTGYGDLVPLHPLARSLCNFEAVIGQLYPATLLAKLVTLELRDR
jgi:hypothetical protein